MPFMTSFPLRSDALLRSALRTRLRQACAAVALAAAALSVSTGGAMAQTMPAPLSAPSFGQPTPDTGAAAAASAPVQPGALQPAVPVLGEGVLVSVNDDIISSYDLKQRMLLLMATSGVQVTQDNYAQFQSQALRSLVDEHLQNQEMTHWKVTVDNKEIDGELTRMAQQSNLTKDQLLAELKKIGVEPGTLRDQIRAQLGWNDLVGGRYHSNAQVGRDQVDATMDKIIADGQKPQYAVSEIFLDPNTAGGMDNAMKGAQQLFDQLNQKVAPFQAVARQFSNAPSAANGGDEGWLVSGNIDPQVEATLKTMKVGDISAPIQTKDGVYIYYLRDKSDGNSDEVVQLKQASVPLPAGASAQQVAAAQLQLTNFKSRAPSCAAVDELGKKTEGVRVEDLGETQLSDMVPEFATALRPLKDNQTTSPMPNGGEMKMLYVCDKRLAGDNALTRDQVQTQLVNNRLSMLGKRYLRDLHNTATIEDHH
jgi:peptidyl-prolyl cis-trans isomerase SurA